MFDEDALSRNRGSCNCDGGGEQMTKITAKKIEDYEVDRLFFDFYWHLAEPDDEVDQSHSTR